VDSAKQIPSSPSFGCLPFDAFTVRVATSRITDMLIEYVRPVRPMQIRTFSRLSSSLHVPTGSITAQAAHCYHDRYISPPLHSKRLVLVSRPISDLGLRSHRPPDSVPDPENLPSSADLPDQEWEIRTGLRLHPDIEWHSLMRTFLFVGRALYVIQETLPEFFETGLITSINKSTGMPSKSVSAPNTNPLEDSLLNNDEEPIYSPNIQMSYTPPSRLPASFPKTFHIKGMLSTFVQ